VASDLLLFIVEMHTPGEIVEARRPFSAETVAGAFLEDRLVADFN